MDLINAANLILNIFTIIFFAMAVYGFFMQRIYALGRWYYRSKSSSQYWQVFAGYILFGIVLMYLNTNYLSGMPQGK